MRRARALFIVRVMLLCASGVVAATVIVAWPLIVAEWHILRLTTGDLETRIQAAGRLGAMQSDRAVPKLVEVFAGTLEQPMTSPERWLGSGTLRALAKIGRAGAAGLAVAQPGWSEAQRGRFLAQVRYLRGEALPLFPVVTAIVQHGGEDSMRVAALEAAACVLARGGEVMPIFFRSLADPSPEVRMTASRMLLMLDPEDTAWIPALLSLIEGEGIVGWKDLDALAQCAVKGSFARIVLGRQLQRLIRPGFGGPNYIDYVFHDFANALRRLASGDDPGLAARAMKLLEKLGGEAPPAQEPEPD